MGRFDGKVIVITGSSRGIGLMLAQQLSMEGASMVIMGRNLPVAEEAVKTLHTSDSSMAIRCDVSVEQDTLDMAKAVQERYGKADVLINNAGIFPVKTFEDMTLEDWDFVMGIDLNGTFLACKAIYPLMRKQKKGKIINMASVSGRIGAFGMSHYSAAKGGVIAFTKSIAREMAGLNIQVNAICPGIIETDTALETFPAYSIKDQTRATPAGRLGKEDDIVGTVKFLCSEDSDFIIGQTIAVDGGYTMI